MLFWRRTQLFAVGDAVDTPLTPALSMARATKPETIKSIAVSFG
jgi:hypothetical protein